ncbi:hypothetical protein GCM10023144_02530 [Pigmentiphaga soli]|uniref:Cupin type-2 domain-containing protein n=1 Tax=Pigmentiphaga soli TaxID=1007095 RepID=A0ABP8GEL6_9BURK
MSTSTKSAAPIVKNTAEWLSEMERLARRTTPSFFHLSCQLPKAGRTNQVLGATKMMSVVLKTYAEGGENELHAHINEDHFFCILQGRAKFYGPNGEEREVGKNDCVLLPKGSLYWFHAIEGEPLVMLRVGAASEDETDVMARVGADGQPLDGYSEANKEVPLVLDADRWFE